MEKEYAIGIDLGGTSVKYALIDNEGVFYFQGKLPSKADVSAEAVIGQLVTAINEVKAFAQEKDYKIDGIGIGTPGIVDCTNRIVLGGAENINGWENIHLADRIETETGLPALLGNDANLMGLGETMYGAGQGAISYPDEEINGELIVRLYKQGDPIAKISLEEHCDFLGHGIAGFINIFSPQKIVIGGGLSEAGDFYIQKVSEKARSYAIPDCAVNTQIIAAALGNKAGSIGAASLVFTQLSAPNLIKL